MLNYVLRFVKNGFIKSLKMELKKIDKQNFYLVPLHLVPGAHAPLPFPFLFGFGCLKNSIEIYKGFMCLKKKYMIADFLLEV